MVIYNIIIIIIIIINVAIMKIHWESALTICTIITIYRLNVMKIMSQITGRWFVESRLVKTKGYPY